MSRRGIEIDRLQIRLQGVTPESARSAVGDLGRELLGRLGRDHGQGCERSGNIDHVDAGTVRLTSGVTASELGSTIAGRIAASIDSTAHSA